MCNLIEIGRMSRLFTKNDKHASQHSQKISNNNLREKVKSISHVEFAFGWNKFNLRLIGLWPDQCRQKGQSNLIIRYSSLIWVLWVFAFVVGPHAMFAFFYPSVLEELIQVVSTLVGIIGAMVKMIVVWNNSEVLASCLCILAEDWQRNLSIDELELMMQKAKIGRNISIGFSLLMHCLVWSFVALKALPLFYAKLDVWNTTDIAKVLMYPAYVPFDLKKPSNFAFMWIGQLLGTFSSTIGYTSVDCFISILVIHLCGQLSILRRALLNLLDNQKSLSVEIFRENLATIVRRHDALIRFAKIIEDTVNLMLLVLILIYTVQFGLQLFGLMTAVTERKPGKFPFLQIMFFISYLNITIIHLYLYCYVGEMLMEESEGLALASYSCKWYNLSGRDAKDLILVMQRAKVPLEISAGKFVAFSLQLFSNVLKTSMSYFSVLLTIKEQSL